MLVKFLSKIFLSILFLLGFFLAVTVDLKAEENSVYIAPKILMSYMFEGVGVPVEAPSKDETYSFMARKEFTDSMVTGLALGYQNVPNPLDLPLRLEFEIMFQHLPDLSDDLGSKVGMSPDSSLGANSYLLNLYYDFPARYSYKGPSSFTSYIGAGIGFSRFSGRGDWFRDGSGVHPGNGAWGGKHRSMRLVWDVGAGLAYDFSNKLALDIGYRYMDFGKAKKQVQGENSEVSSSPEVAAHEMVLGLRYGF